MLVPPPQLPASFCHSVGHALARSLSAAILVPCPPHSKCRWLLRSLSVAILPCREPGGSGLPLRSVGGGVGLRLPARPGACGQNGACGRGPGRSRSGGLRVVPGVRAWGRGSHCGRAGGVGCARTGDVGGPSLTLPTPLVLCPGLGGTDGPCRFLALGSQGVRGPGPSGVSFRTG